MGGQPRYSMLQNGFKISNTLDHKEEEEYGEEASWW